ncbi:MAG TPA: nicotinate-nucleotide--dimethylbenzimidazole phosphoribosyltransferase [Jatrophihabitans sp.]
MSATSPRSLEDAAADVAGPSAVVATRLSESLADPARGRLADFAQWLASCQRTALPAVPSRVRLVLIGTGTRDAAVATKADALDVAVRYTVADSDSDSAIASGIAMADAEADAGTDLLILALPTPEPGDAEVSTLAVVCAFAGVEPAKVLARGAAATDPDRWMARLVAVRDKRLELVGHLHDPPRLLAAADNGALSFATGLLLQSAARRTPVVLDGVGALTAALAASAAEPAAPGWWIRSDTTHEPVGELIAALLRIPAVLGLDAARGDGTSGLLSVPILRESVTVPQTETYERGSQ